MFKISNLRSLILFFVFKLSIAYGGYQEQYNKVVVAKTVTTQTLHEIEAYIEGVMEKVNFYKANCQSELDSNSLMTCLEASVFAEARISRIEVLLSYLRTYVQGYPEELSSLRNGMQSRLAKSAESIEHTKKVISQSAKLLKKKSDKLIDDKTQKAILDGALQGKALYYCTSFNKKIELFGLEYQILKAKKAAFSSYFLKYDEVIRFVATAELFKSSCPEKLDFKKATLVADQYSAEVSEKKIIAYIIEQCKNLKDVDFKKKCFKSGSKNPDLLYTLFALEKAGQL